MRVIAGTARHLELKTIEGMETRPTTDRIKETLFNMLQNKTAGRRFLDLFSGSGAIGIEALSRGAKEVVFIEHNPRAVNCIHENLQKTHLEENAVVILADVFQGISQLERTSRAFDYIFMDPPYHYNLEQKVLTSLTNSPLADMNTVVIIEASRKTGTDWLAPTGWKLLKVKEYKTNQHIFATKGER